MIQIESNDFNKYGIHICKTILDWYENNGIQIDSNIPLKLVYRSNKDPEFLPTLNTIYISAKDDKWNQFIYQISHEICHYIIWLSSNNNYHYISWLEESICEAVSYFWLHKYTAQWNIIGFLSLDKNYYKKINTYLKNELNKEVDYTNLNVYNLESLDKLNSISQDLEGRLKRHRFVKELYKYVDKNTIESLINYQKFRKSDILIDTNSYMTKYSNNAVQYICTTQDKIETNGKD